MSHDASRLAEQARESVREGVAGARDEASRQAGRGIDRTAEEIAHTAHALEAAAAEFGEGSLQHQLFHRAADGLSDLSGALRGKTVGDMAADLAHFGRRNPAAFLGGAALVGFAIARFARASQHDQYGRGQGAYRGPYGGASGAGSTPGAQQSPTAGAPYGTSGAPTTPVAGPAATGTTTGAGSASPSGARPVPGSSTGSTGGGSTASLGAGASAGSDPLKKGKPNV